MAKFWGIFPLFLLPFLLPGQTDTDLFPTKPEPATYLHDYAGWLSAEDRSTLEIKLQRYFDSTSTQIVVMIRPDIGNYDKSSYAFELGNRWGVGQKDKNNGIVVLIKSEPPDRGVFIATGYGTEGSLPDVLAGRIIRNIFIPAFKEQRYALGINAGLDAIIQALAGEFQADETTEAGGGWIFLLFLAIMLGLVIFGMRAGGKSARGFSSGGRRNNGSDWWGGGGFGGGGGWGGSGGGGFGGGGSFGGGSFGGGGAGGGW